MSARHTRPLGSKPAPKPNQEGWWTGKTLQIKEAVAKGFQKVNRSSYLLLKNILESLIPAKRITIVNRPPTPKEQCAPTTQVNRFQTNAKQRNDKSQTTPPTATSGAVADACICALAGSQACKKPSEPPNQELESLKKALIESLKKALKERNRDKISELLRKLRKADQATKREFLRVALEEPNVKAMLRVIRYAEGTDAEDGYTKLFGNGHFDSCKQHPNRVVAKGGYESTAAGAYQILYSTWDGLVQEYGFSDFCPESQDMAAVALILRRGVLVDVIEGNLCTAIQELSYEWASLPDPATGKSRYSQPAKSFNALLKKFHKFREIYIAPTKTAIV
ncbi:hypothetical protein HRbin15_02378 [bacterium HR15]|nr:hypothetical protein HRbin15_02378 [bacterium HR15]